MGNLFSEIKPEKENNKQIIYYSDDETYIGSF